MKFLSDEILYGLIGMFLLVRDGCASRVKHEAVIVIWAAVLPLMRAAAFRLRNLSSIVRTSDAWQQCCVMHVASNAISPFLIFSFPSER